MPSIVDKQLNLPPAGVDGRAARIRSVAGLAPSGACPQPPQGREASAPHGRHRAKRFQVHAGGPETLTERDARLFSESRSQRTQALTRTRAKQPWRTQDSDFLPSVYLQTGISTSPLPVARIKVLAGIRERLARLLETMFLRSGRYR